MADAKFEDGDDGPLRLLVQGAEDLSVASALLQDAVLPVSELRYDRKRRSFGLLVNRFRWEDAEAARKAGLSIKNLQLNPSLPLISNTCFKAIIFIQCWLLLSAVPRPYSLSPLISAHQGLLPSAHWFSIPKITSPWP